MGEAPPPGERPRIRGAQREAGRGSSALRHGRGARRGGCAPTPPGRAPRGFLPQTACVAAAPRRPRDTPGAAGAAESEAHPGRGGRTARRRSGARHRLGRGRGGEAAEGRWPGRAGAGPRADSASWPPTAPRAPLTGRSGWRTGSRRRGLTCRRRQRAAEGERRCLAGLARNE